MRYETEEKIELQQKKTQNIKYKCLFEAVDEGRLLEIFFFFWGCRTIMIDSGSWLRRRREEENRGEEMGRRREDEEEKRGGGDEKRRRGEESSR